MIMVPQFKHTENMLLRPELRLDPRDPDGQARK